MACHSCRDLYSWTGGCKTKNRADCREYFMLIEQIARHIHPCLWDLDNEREGMKAKEDTESQSGKPGSKPPMDISPMSRLEDIKKTLSALEGRLRVKQTVADKDAERVTDRLRMKDQRVRVVSRVAAGEKTHRVARQEGVRSLSTARSWVRRDIPKNT